MVTFIQKKKTNGWFYLCLTLISSLFYLYRDDQCTYSGLSGVSFSSTPQNNLSKPLAAFPQNCRRNNGQQ